MSDSINPDHYHSGGIDCIDYLRAKLSPDEFRGFLKGNVIKYLSRAEMKGGTEDYQKAAWYSAWLEGRDPRVKYTQQAAPVVDEPPAGAFDKSD